MSQPYDEVARKAAARLANELNPSLPQLTERVLAEGTPGGPSERYDPATAIALAALLVNLAGLAWKIHQDLRKSRVEPRREVVERRVRVEFRETASIPTELRDRMISVVVEEVASGESGE